MNPVWLLFGFNGRINRARFWFGCVVNVVFMLLLGGVVVGITHLVGGPARLGFNVEDVFAVLDPAAWRSLSTDRLPQLAIKAIGTPVFLWIYVAVAIKRLHDRNRSGWWLVPFFVVPGLLGRFEDRLEDSVVLNVLLVVEFGLVLWGFVEMGLLRGTRGDNRFGSDPLAPMDRRPNWDQQSELEWAPHAAPTDPRPGPH